MESKMRKLNKKEVTDIADQKILRTIEKANKLIKEGKAKPLI